MKLRFTDENGDINVGAVIKAVVFGIIGLIVVINLFSSFRVVQAGEVEVVKRFGRVTGKRLDPGLHWIIPFADSTANLPTRKLIYETTSKEKQEGSQADYQDFPVDTNTSDGQQVDIYYTVRFSVDPLKASWVIQNIGSIDALVERIVKTESRIWIRNIPREFEAESLYTGDGVIDAQKRIEERLQPVFEDNGLVLDAIGIREIKFTEEYITAIENKQLEAVKVKTAENIAERATHEKEARITRAEGEAREQELQQATISDKLLQKWWMEKWDGVLPTYMMGDSQALIQLPR